MARLAISWSVLLLPFLVPAIGSAAPPPGATGRDAPPADARGQPGTVCLRPHRDEVGAVAVSPDGRLVATGCGSDHAVGLWDAARGTALHVLRFKCDFPDHSCRTREVRCVAFSPDSRRVVTGGNGRIYFWDTATGKEVGQLAGKRREDRYAANVLAFAPDGRVLATTGWHEAGVRLWDPASGGLIRRIYPHGEREKHHGAVACLAFSPDGRVLATGSVSWLVRMRSDSADPPAQESVQLWDVATGTKLRGLRPAAAAPAFVAFSPDGNLLATSATWDQPVQLWDAAGGKEVRRFSGHEERRPGGKRNPLAFSPDGSLLATGGEGSTVVLWEVASGQVVRVLHGHTRPPRSLAFTPDGRRLVSGSADTTALVWPVAPAVKRPARWDGARREAAWRALGLGAERAYPFLWSLAAAPEEAVALLKVRLRPEEEVDARELARLVADLGADEFAVREEAMRRLRGLGARADGALRRALVGQTDLERRRRLERLRAEAARQTESPEALRDRRAVQALERAGTPAAEALLEILARGAESGLRTRAAQAALLRLEATRRRARRPPVATAPAGVPEGQQPRRLYTHKGEVYAVVFAPDGRTAFSAGHDGAVRRWDLGAGRELSALPGHAGGTFALTTDPAGRRLASGGADGQIRVWDTATGRAVRALAGHKGAVFAIAFSPDGKRMASGGADGTARLWDVATGREQRRLRAACERVTIVAFTPDGRTLLTGGVSCAGGSINGVIIPRIMSQPVQAWSVAEGKEVRKLEQTGSLLTPALDGRELAIARVEAGTVWNGGKDLFVHASGMVLLVDARTGKPRLTLEGYGGAVALSPDGTHLATGRGSRLHVAGKIELRWADRIEDSRLHLWETATGRPVLRFPGEPPTVLAFAPDGRRLLIGTRTGAVYLAETRPSDIAASTKLDRETLANLWQDLAAEAPVAYRAAAALSAARRQAPGYLAEHLWPAPANDAVLGRLVADLSAERYVVRRSARMELARRGIAAGPALQAARKRVKSARVRRWLDELLTDPGIGRFPIPLRRVRAVRVLEQVGTPEAREILKRLAASTPEAELIREAKAALRRLDRRSLSP